VISPDTGRVQASFAAVAKHYGVRVVACPPRRGNRKVWSRRPIMLLHNGSGAPWPTIPASRLPSGYRTSGAPPAGEARWA
jgi:hypothetical protein